MKNTFKSLGIIVLLAVIGFSMASCTGGGGKSLNSAEALEAYLDKQPANGPDKPIKISMAINDPMLYDVAHAIKYAEKYVSLNITGNALTEIEDEAFDDCDTLVSINIPSSVKYIGRYAFGSCSNLTSIKFEGSTLRCSESA